jgi:DNA polymerase zeta
MHVHGIFPYLYVPFDGTQPISQYIQQFALSIDKAVNIALGNAASSRQHVYKISVVSGM